MKLEHVQEAKLREDLLKIFAKYLDLSQYKIFFFGSRVSGNNQARSDIDIGIMGKNPIPLPAKFSIEEEMENFPILYRIDVVDFASAPESFQREALRFAQYLN